MLGAGGVFIADVREARAAVTAQRLFSIDGVRAHYLLPGDTARISATGDLQVVLSTRAPQLPVGPETAWVTQDRLLDTGASSFLKLATAMGRTGAPQGYGTTHNSTDTRNNKQSTPYYSATLSRDTRTVFRGVMAADDITAPVAYTGLRVAFAPCEGECLQPTSAPLSPR